MAKNNPKSRQAEDTDKTEVSQITKIVKATTVVPTPEAEPVQGFDTIKKVSRDLPDGAPELARRANSQARDFRTNLGRGKSAIVEVE